MKFRQVLSFVIAVATLASCNKEEISDNVSTNFVLKASVENSTVSTRAGFDSGAKFYWSKNDKLGVTTTNSKTQFTALTLQGDGGAASGTFSGDIYGSVEGYAVYPHSRSHNLDNATLTYQFPANYSYSSVDTEYFHATDQGKANSFNFAMWGKIQNGSVGMKHLGGVFMVAFTSIPAEGTFILSADQKINGTYSVDLTAGTPEIKIDADYTPTDAEKEVVITFANATEGQTGVFYVPAPTGNYTGVTATLLNAEGEIVKEVACGDVVIKRAYGKILNFTNGSIVGGGTAEVKNVVAANVALENENITSVKIAEVSASDAITIPAKSASEIASTPHTIDLSNANLPVEGITINVTEGSAGTETVEHLTVIVPSGTEATGNLNINAPGTTVTIEAVNGTVIDIIEAITAENTLVIGEGVTVKTLKIIGGNVRINGTVEKIFDANDNEYTLVTSVDALTQAISGDKSHVILGADIQSTNIITINKAFTLNGNGYTLTSTASRAINVETTGTVTINNLNIVAGERAVNIINKAATVNLNNVTATAKNNAVMIATSAGAVKLVVNKCDFTGLAVINVAGAGSQVTITDTKITNVDATEAEDYGAITVWTSAAGASVKVEGGEIKVADDSRKAWIFPDDATVEGVDDIGYINYLVDDAGFDTFEEAIKEAKSGAKIRLARNIELNSYLTISEDVTLNLNGKNITASGCALYVNGGTLTIEGEGTVIGSSGNNNNQPAVWAATNGAVVINGGTYNVGSDGSGKTNDCIYANGGVITIYAGTFSNTGTYDPSAGGVVINANNKKESSKVIINGGTFNPAEGCVAYEQQDVDEGRVVVNK